MDEEDLKEFLKALVQESLVIEISKAHAGRYNKIFQKATYIPSS